MSNSMLQILVSGFLKLSLSLALSMGMNTLAHAVEVKDIYKASVVVDDRSDQSLRHGSQEALAEVLIRASGDSRAMESYDITQAMANPSRYVEQYDFDRITRDNPETGLPEPAYQLNVAFNAQGINQLIRNAGLPIWASNRAEVLVWLLVEDETGRRLVNGDSTPEIVAQLHAEASRRGLPISFPINDLEDQLAVTSGDVWGMFMDRIIAGSARYNPGAILVGKVYAPGTEGQTAAWTFWMDQQQELIETKGQQLAEVLAPAVDYAADKLAEKYAVVLGEGDADYVWLNVLGVETLTDFAELTAYLDNLVAVKQANLDLLQQAKTRFRVFLETDMENLQQLLALDKKLIKVPDQEMLPRVTLSADNSELTVSAEQVMPEVLDPSLGLDTVVPAMKQRTPEATYHWHRTYNEVEYFQEP